MGNTGGYSVKTTSIKCAMERVPVEAVCVIPTTEPGHSAIELPHISMWLCGAVYWHRRKAFIAVDMGSGHWQLVSENEARERLTLFTPNGKQRWKLMPMGALKAAPTFVAMAMELKTEWGSLAQERGLKFFVSKIIFDYVLLYGRIEEQILDCFITVLYVLKHHCATLKLKKWKWLWDRCKF